MGRKREVRAGTSASSRVRAVPIFNHPINSHTLARAILAMALADADKQQKKGEQRQQRTPRRPSPSIASLMVVSNLW